MPERNNDLTSVYLNRAVNELSPLFQILTPRDVSRQIASQEVQGFGGADSERVNVSPTITRIIDLILNVTEGAVITRQLVETLNELSSQTDARSAETTGERSALDRLQNILQVYYAGNSTANSTDNSSEARISNPGLLNNVLGEVLRGIDERVASRFGVIQVMSTRISPAVRNMNSLSLFLNGMPTIELARCVPHIDVKFHFNRSPLDSNNRLNSLSIFKFLEGAARVGLTSPAGVMSLANSTRGELIGAEQDASGQNTLGTLSVAGMELFNSPQTMVNANEIFSPSNRAEPVKDKFRPFMSFKSLTFDLVAAGGLMSYKTAKMEFTLHDSSRLYEIAEFIKPDLYSTAEIYLEYGWSHPDGPTARNPYADVMNGMKAKEKYGIRNMQMTISEFREANITLDLYMRGGQEFFSETIGRASRGTLATLNQIRELSQTISRYRQRLNNRTSGARGGNRPAAEIRGVQILDSASDYQNNISLTSDMIRNFNEFSAAMRRGSVPSDSQLANVRSALESLIGTSAPARRGGATTTRTDSRLQQLRSSIQQEITQAITEIMQGNDPFLPTNITITRGTRQITIDQNTNRAEVRSSRRNTSEPAVPAITIQANTFSRRNISLGSLLLNFVGKPLMDTNKFDDIQFLFYQFNQYAGFANTSNISQFVVDANYFTEQYVRFRTENASRAANVNLMDFLQFIASTIVDDPMAVMYGIDSLYRATRDSNGALQATPGSENAVAFQASIESRLRNRTPGGEFRMPQIQYYLETIPKRAMNEGEVPDRTVSILRIHVFDQVASPHDGQLSLLTSNRDDVLNAFESIPASVTDGNEGIRESNRANVNSIINRARSIGLIEEIPPDSSGTVDNPRVSWRIAGGPRAIKDFVMKTMPYIIYGVQGTTIKSAQLTTQQDAALSTVNMLRSLRGSSLNANGEQPGGLPLSIVPCELSLSTFGCPLFQFGQQIFIDFDTGTSADNIYGVTQVTHKLEPGSFSTDVKLAPLDAYGRYNSFTENIRNHLNQIRDIQNGSSSPNQNSSNNAAGTGRNT